MRVYEIWNPDVLDREDVKALFERCFADPKFNADPDVVRRFVAEQIASRDRSVRLWVAVSPEHGVCGMSLMSFSVCPLSPHPWISHFVAEVPEAREPLVRANFIACRELGFDKVSIMNMTGRDDGSHMRLFRKFARGNPRGSVIVYQLES